MKFLLVFSILCFSAILIGTSCEKQTIVQLPNNHGAFRKVRFSLFSDNNFSGNNGNITFTLSIRKLTNHILWDTMLSPMKIKDIPDFAHGLVVEKLVPGNDSSLLNVGFLYSIENVGNSWFWDISNAGENFKAVDFNFR